MSVEFRRLLVMVAGVITTIATVFLFGTVDGLDVLHSYTKIIFTLPTGALFLGLLAGSGYGLTGYFLLDSKFTVRMLAFVTLTMFGFFWLLAYVEYASYAPEGVEFFDFFDQSTRMAAMTTGGSLEYIEPLGPAGYSYRGLELFALMLGGIGGCVIIPLVRSAVRGTSKDELR